MVKTTDPTIAGSIRLDWSRLWPTPRGQQMRRSTASTSRLRLDVRAIRTRLGMTQQEFAMRFGFSINTLRHWEQGLRNRKAPVARISS
jgi:putative transcriptional regulator